MDNPLLQLQPFPRFSEIQASHIAPSMASLLGNAGTALELVCEDGFPANWQAISTELDTALEALSKTWGLISHLNSVADSTDWRAAYNQELNKVSGFYARLGANEKLYQKYTKIDKRSLSTEQARALDNSLREARLNGAELQGAEKAQFIANEEKLSSLTQKFHENVMDASDAFAYYAHRDELDGLPEDVMRAAQLEAQSSEGSQHHGRYKLTLKLPVYLPVMQYAKSSALRRQLYLAYISRASDVSEQDLFDNSEIMLEILKLRHEKAQLLGFRDYAELSLVSKMADSPAEVVGFLRELATRARPYALQEVEEMRVFAQTELGIEDPQAWDWTYISEHLKEVRYSYSDNEIKQYFTLPKVLDGLFSLLAELFEVSFIEETTEVWHADVKFYRAERANQTLAHFYLDPTARSGKQNGAWMDSARARWLRPDTAKLQTPIAYLVCNYSAGQDGKPALLTHDDVITLFHEMGHGLHHMLTQVNELSVSGISGVEWDAVELPSQFMENFCWEWDVVSRLSAHVVTGERLPKELFDKLVAAKNFQTGLATLRQVEFALFDMLLHSEGQILTSEPSTKPAYSSILELQRAVNQEIAVLPLHNMNRSAHTFGHIFSGGYAAGYYSYKWAEVLSADAYAAFEESRLDNSEHNPQTAKSFLKEILEAGGSRPAMESFVAFRKRNPTIQALLRHQGMSQET